MNKQLLNWLAVLFIIGPAIYLLIIFPSLPQTVPVHFGVDGTPDRFGSKSELILVTSILTVLNVGVFLLLSNVHKIDPKKTAGKSRAIIQKIALGVVVLMSGICFLVIHSAQHGILLFGKFFIPALGLFFAWLGYMMRDLEPNYFVGLRTPWTLESEETWRKTHKMASKQWIVGGLLMAILGFVLPFKIAIISFVIIVLIITIIPLVFSYRYFKKIKKDK